MDYVICIPSYDRSDILKENTIGVLERNNISKDKIKIYVVKEEYEKYKTLLPEYEIIVGEKGLVNQRNFILNDNDEKNVIMMDDDVIELKKKDGKKTTDFFNLEEIIQLGFQKCNENNTKIWGLYPIDNGFFMNDTITTDLKFIMGILYGVINNKDSNPFMEWKGDVGDDWARTLHYYTIYEKLIRINYIAPKSKIYSTKGGYQTNFTKTERLTLENEAFQKLYQQYPHLCKILPKKNGRNILKLHHYKTPQKAKKKNEVLEKFKVHQIFGLLDDGELDDIPFFKQCSLKVKEWCKNNNYEYKLWNKNDCEELLNEYSIFKPLYDSVKYKIMKVDIIRFIIIHKYGGIYLDLDVVPNIKKIENENDFCLLYKKIKPTKELYELEVIQSPKKNPVMLEYLKYIITQIEEKDKIEIYNKWKLRYIYQTTGPHSLTRFIKLNKIEVKTYLSNSPYRKKGEKVGTLNLKGDEDFISYPSISYMDTISSPS